MQAYRIGDRDGQYPVFCGKGASGIDDGRWHNIGQNVIYTSKYYSTALLEKLVYLGELPPDQHFVEITIPAHVSYEEITERDLPGWYESDKIISRNFGSKWFDDCRSAILIVPSVVARVDKNVLINPNHPDSNLITPENELRVLWDERLFAS